MQLPELLIPPAFAEIARKVQADERITDPECLLLYEEADTGFLGMLANFIRTRKNGQAVYYIRNFHIEPTNVCVNRCKFCSYSHHFSAEQWDLSVEEMLDTVRQQDATVREVHITGAVHPDKDLHYYATLIRKIKEVRPDLHVKALSAVELEYVIHKANMSYEHGLRYLKEHGLGSIPGGGAEIFDHRIREKLCGTKATTQQWLDIHEAAHKLGMSSNATMLYGHLETYEQRVIHMGLLRDLQDRTHGFNAFIPLKFKNGNNEMSGITEVSVVEDMRNYAVARIYLDNFPHIKGYWPMIGKAMAQLSLSFGVDDLDGTINDSTKIYSLAGSTEQNPEMTVSEMVDLIRQVNRIPVERDSNYHPV
jgi:aminodeoxyfutalosine synthase